MSGITIHEVGLRDGLQIEERAVPTERKLDWIARLAAAGLRMIQVGSFVNPQKVPQMADTDELFRRLSASDRVPGVVYSGLVLNERGLERGLACGVDLLPDAFRVPGVVYSALVLNERGLERGLACGVDYFCMGVSASDTHSRKNTGMGTSEALARILAIADAARTAGAEVQVSVQSAFGCGYEGVVPPARVLDLVSRFLAAGLRTVSLADTAGHGTPDQVERLFTEVRALSPDVACACHLHDTYGLGIANAVAALRAGVTSFETAVGGLGGCPFTRVAGGNVCTEDFVHLLHRLGHRQDVDLDAIVEVACGVEAFLGRDLPGRVHKTGPIPQP
jgi:hydroxymethylglutaryl-CoA lyase